MGLLTILHLTFRSSLSSMQVAMYPRLRQAIFHQDASFDEYSNNTYPYPQVKLVQALREKKTCDEVENTGRVGQPSNFGLVLNYLAHANPDG